VTTDSVRHAMAEDQSLPERSDHPTAVPRAPRRSEDPWVAFGAIVAGVLLYGMAGWLLDRWLGTSFLVVVGILLGAGLGLYRVWVMVRAPKDPD